MKKAIAYVRISDKDQSNWSLDGQEKDIRRYCDHKEIELLTVFKDDGQSAKNFDRAEWKELESFVRKYHRQIDQLLVIAFDRFSRNVSEALNMMNLLENRFGIEIISVTQPIGLHRQSPYFFQMRAQMLLGAEIELRVIRDRTKTGMVRAAREGRYVAKAPIGYKNARDAQNKPIITIDKKREGFIRSVFKLFLAGTPQIEIMRALKCKEFAISGNSSITRILTNPVYAGLIRVPAYYDDPETLVEGLHKAIISKSDYWKAQELLSKPQPKLFYNEEVPLRGTLKHTCGKLLTAGNSKGKLKHYWYYVCNSCRSNLSANRLHSQFEQILQHLNFSAAEINYITKGYADAIKNRVKDREKELDACYGEIKNLKAKLNSLEEKYICNDIDKASYRKWRVRFQNEKAMLEERVHQLTVPISRIWKRYQENLLQLSSLPLLYNSADIHKKQAFVKLVFDNQLHYSDGIYRTPYILPTFAAKALILKEKRLLEIEQPLKNKGKNPVSAPGGT